jgi:hypothetical protein
LGGGLGCQIFLGTTYQNGGKYTKLPQNIPNASGHTMLNTPVLVQNIPNYHKISQLATKYTKWTENLPNGRKIYRHLPLQDPPNFAQIGIFCLKTIWQPWWGVGVSEKECFKNLLPISNV